MFLFVETTGLQVEAHWIYCGNKLKNNFYVIIISTRYEHNRRSLFLSHEIPGSVGIILGISFTNGISCILEDHIWY